MLLLCFGILMQMLGLPFTLWDPTEAADLVNPVAQSILQACAIPSTLLLLHIVGHVWRLSPSQPASHDPLLTSDLIRPPTT